MDNSNILSGAIPSQGFSTPKILQWMAEKKQLNAAWQTGKMWSLVYQHSPEHSELIQAAFQLHLNENYINPLAFKSIQLMEQEVVRMTSKLLHGDEKTVGSITSGGTESIFLAVYTAREYARKHKTWIKKPEIIAPKSIHPAFDKACHYLGIKLIKTNMRADFRADVTAFDKRINRNTIMIAASAPHYPQGILDPIAALGKLAERYELLFHVDACLGGFILPWVEKLGYPISPFDFRIAGVSSMSADVHKFGYGAKGASVLLFRDMALMRHQFFVASDWSGGIFVTAGFQGTKSGGAIAAAFASLKGLGEAGFLQSAQRIMEGAQRLREAIASIPALQILGEPCVSITAFSSTDKACDIYLVASYLSQRGWFVDRQQAPRCIHTTVMPHHLPILDTYIQDLRDAVAWAKANPHLANEGETAVYGLMADLPIRSVVKQEVRNLFQEMYGGGGYVSEQTSQASPMHLSPFQRWVARILRWFR